MIRALLVLAAAAALVACSGEEASSAPSQSAASQSAGSSGSGASGAGGGQVAQLEPLTTADDALAAAEAFLTENAAKEGVVTTPSGLQYKILASGPADGMSPTPGQWVCVHYRGTFTNGEEFDSSYSRNQAASFPSDGVIQGWVEALSMMKPGDAWQLTLHPDLAYGSQGRPSIPPNSVLLFDVELIALLSGPPARGADCATDSRSELDRGLEFLAEHGAEDGVTTTETGLQYRVLSSGPADGATPTPGQWVCVHYRGTFVDGEEFDSSYSRNQATAFPSDGVIPGWVEALTMMKPGDSWQLAIPSDLAYGPAGIGPIPPDSVLLFDVELVKLLDAPWTSNGDCAA